MFSTVATVLSSSLFNAGAVAATVLRRR